MSRYDYKIGPNPKRFELFDAPDGKEVVVAVDLIVAVRQLSNEHRWEMVLALVGGDYYTIEIVEPSGYSLAFGLNNPTD